MLTLKNHNKFSSRSMSSMLLRFSLMFFTALIIAVLVQNSWTNHINLYHTILETACVFIALSIFTSIWYTCDQSHDSNHILGFGYLAVAIFDALHAYYHLKLDLTAISYYDLSTRFWILGRLTEAVTILMVVTSCKIFITKYINILITLGFAVGVSYFVVAYHDVLPLLLTAQGVTPLKKFLEYAVIAIYIISLLNMKDKLHHKGRINYQYIFMSLLLSICAEVFFATYILISNISWTLGHILKIISYFYLFKGSFISTVIYPYIELEEEHKKLEIKNREICHMSDTMKDLLDALPIGIQNYDGKGKLKYTNKRFTELLQCCEDKVTDLSALEIGAIAENSLQSDRLKTEAAATIRTFRTFKGEHLKLSVKTHAIKNGTLVMVNDTKKEQELQNLNIQTETILNSINNGVVIVDENKKIVLVNKVFEEVYEIERNKVLGMDIDDLHEATCTGCKKLSDHMINEGMTGQVYGICMTSFKGNKKELNFYIAPIKNIEGDIIGGIGVSTDVTEQKLEQQRMVQQEKLALLGQMGAGIVHETRNFLTTIKGRCQLIDLLTEDENIKKHSAKINSDVEEVNRIISEFLFLSKPRETELAEISIHDVFESIKSIIESSSLIRGVNLEIQLCDDMRYMLCDESQLKQVILNICKNGIDAMADQMNAKLTIETGVMEENNEIYIKIKDNGKGITAENLEKMGTPFFTTKTSGTGLGLSVCYKIIKEHRGRIDVCSELGKGTVFTIILPYILDEEGI